MDAVLGDIKIADPSADPEMADITPRAVQKQEKKEKKEKSKDKEGKKDKKRRHSEVNGDEEVEAVSDKKIKKKKSKTAV